MLVSDRIYNRIPQIWMIMGALFLLLALATGPDFQYFYAYLLLSALSGARAFQIYQQRRKISRRNRTTVLTETQKLD